MLNPDDPPSQAEIGPYTKPVNCLLGWQSRPPFQTRINRRQRIECLECGLVVKVAATP
jgi:hypothetical protein